jgi:hypothetical protein
MMGTEALSSSVEDLGSLGEQFPGGVPDAGRRFRAQVDAYWEACEAWADGQLAEVAASSEEAKKRGSKPTFRTKSFRKSKRSDFRRLPSVRTG